MLGVHEDANAGYPQQENGVVHPQLPPGAGRDHVGAVLASTAEEYLVRFNDKAFRLTL